MRTTKKWEPKKWRVDHEVVMLMHISGKSNKEIARINDKTEVWVSLVINSNKGKELVENIRNNLPIDDIKARYTRIVEKSSLRILDYLENQEAFEKNPGVMVDRAIRAIGTLDSTLNKGNSSIHTIEKSHTERVLVLTTNENTERITKALEKTQLVTETHRLKASNE